MFPCVLSNYTLTNAAAASTGYIYLCIILNCAKMNAENLKQTITKQPQFIVMEYIPFGNKNAIQVLCNMYTCTQQTKQWTVLTNTKLIVSVIIFYIFFFLFSFHNFIVQLHSCSSQQSIPSYLFLVISLFRQIFYAILISMHMQTHLKFIISNIL